MSEQFEGLTRGATNGGDEIVSTFVEFSLSLFPFSVSTRPEGVDTVDVNKLPSSFEHQVHNLSFLCELQIEFPI